ncbi:MAG: hypothetical protein JM58_11090 [Peptococcaceae bacterium BICA1-8]|nr:MAG: hypothetical protein JM58_11090 [Peptococcaceae bacterium BICA1-8]
MAIKIICCKNQRCKTDQLDLTRLKSDLKRPNLELVQILDLCINLKKINLIYDDLVICGCDEKVIKSRLEVNRKKIVFAPIREECLWLYQDREACYKQVILQIKLALNRLKFIRKNDKEPLKSFNEKISHYIEIIDAIGPNPFKV